MDGRSLLFADETTIWAKGLGQDLLWPEIQGLFKEASSKVKEKVYP